MAKHPGGRPSNFGKVNKDAVKLMCERGFTDAEICQCLHIAESTWNRWKQDNTEFWESIKSWKAGADEEVERSLYERACGYSCPETKAQWVESSQITEDGLIKVGHWEYADMAKHYPPDPTSMIFWLKNRQPEKWRDKVEHAHSGNINLTIAKEDAECL